MSHATAPTDFSNIRRLRGVAQLRAIGARLETCDTNEREVLGQLLIQLATTMAPPSAPAPVAMIQQGMRRFRAGGDPAAVADAALFQLAHMWSTWPSEVRIAALAIGRGRWNKFAEVLARDSNVNVRGGLALLVVDSMDASLARAMNLLLTDRDRGVAQTAERAWIEVAARLSGLSSTRLVGVPRMTAAIPSSGEFVKGGEGPMRAALGEALRAFPEHCCRGVLLSAILLLDPHTLRSATESAHDDPLSRITLSREESASGSVRGFLRTSKLPIVAERAMEWLAVAPLARAAGDRISKVASALEVKSLADRWALTLRPARRMSLGEITASELLKLGTNVASDAKAEELPESTRARWVDMLDSFRFGPGERTRAIEPLLVDPRPLVRNAISRRGTYRDAVDLAFDSDGRVACSAALRASLIGTGRATETVDEEAGRFHIWGFMALSRDAGVRAIARGEITRLSCWKTGLLGARAAMRRSLASDHEGTVRALREQLGTADDRDVPSLVSVVRVVGLATELEALLVELAARRSTENEESSRSLATLVTTLGDSRGTAGLEALQGFRTHGNARVRANAVQALGRRARFDAWNARRLLASMIELKSDTQHRVRANALRSIIDVAGMDKVAGLGTTVLHKPEPAAAQQAVESLVSMLTDHRVGHRLAGVWLASRTLHQPAGSEIATRAPELTARVQELARFDGDSMVRHRASATAERIARATRLGWKTPMNGASEPAWSWNAA